MRCPYPPRPRQALILAAGLGTRLRPLTWKTPKPLMSVWGVPLIDHAVALLQRWGVEQFAINTHWKADLLRQHLARRWPDIAFRISHEPEILGTGGALLPLRDLLEPLQSFWLFNADIVASLDPTPLLQQHAECDALATLWLTPDAGPRTVELRPDGRVATFRSRTPAAPGTLTFTGVHLLSGRIYRHLDTTLPAGIVPAYERALAAGEHVLGRHVPGAYWADCGMPQALLDLHRELRIRAREGHPGGEFYHSAADWHGQACLGEAAQIEPGAEVADCVLGPRTRVRSGVRLTNCLVGPGVVVHHDADHAVLARPSDFEDPRVDAAVSVLGWTPEETAVEALDARGSDRGFFRIACGPQRAMLCVYGAQRPENARYAGHASALRQAGIPVPGLLAESPEARWLVLEDLGGDDLLGRLRRQPPSAWATLYAPVLDTVLRLHRNAAAAVRTCALEPAFDATVYAWEHALFAEHLLRRRLGAGPGETGAILGELETFHAPLCGAHSVIVHRDLQSSNIFFRNDRAHLIDFQGMRFGPPAYDLASLLCDPYAALPRALRRKLLRNYAAQVPWGTETLRLFPVAAVQRLVQALGAYARLAAFPGTERFAAFIAPAARILIEESEDQPGLDRLRAVARTLAAPDPAELAPAERKTPEEHAVAQSADSGLAFGERHRGHAALR